MGLFGFDLGGYVLAGGKSSRMGRDKAMLELAGKPLVHHAVMKLQRFCEDVHILSGNSELAAYAPLIQDLHPGCGPIGGLEAAFKHSSHEWNLFMPVDMPFLPSPLLFGWVASKVGFSGIKGTRIALFTVSGIPQPLFSILHRDVAPFVSAAVSRGEYKVFPVLETAGRELEEATRSPLHQVFHNDRWGEESSAFVTIEGGSETGVEAWRLITDAQQMAKHLWFANLNTPEEFAEAERHLDALDT